MIIYYSTLHTMSIRYHMVIWVWGQLLVVHISSILENQYFHLVMGSVIPRLQWNGTKLVTYLFIHPLTNSIHPSIHPFIHSFIHSSTHSSIHSFNHPSIFYSFNHPSIPSIFHSFNHTIHSSFVITGWAPSRIWCSLQNNWNN